MDDVFIRHFLKIRIAERYLLCKRLCAGTFGLVYLGEAVSKRAQNLIDKRIGRDVQTDHKVAVKLEHHDIAPSILRQEADIYFSLK